GCAVAASVHAVRPPAGDRLDAAGALADVAGGRADEPTGALLLEDVRRPPGRAGTGEHRREHLRRDLGEVEEDGCPELDVGRQHAIWATGVELVEGGLLERRGDLEAWGIEPAAGLPQDAGAGVLGAVDAVTEA